MPQSIPTLTNDQAAALAGKCWVIDGSTFQFRPFGFDGREPWISGAEGKAFPLGGPDGRVAAYLKFFTHASGKRVDRTRWLIDQRIPTWDASLRGAPVRWVSSTTNAPLAGIDFDFAASWCAAAPGLTWLEWKRQISEGRTEIGLRDRWRSILDLIRSLAILEREDLHHGDLSPTNIVLNISSTPVQPAPALYLIDFDAFVSGRADKAIAQLSVAEGGKYGSPGYTPPELTRRQQLGHDVAPCSDRFARDMLLLELLTFDSGFPSEAPPRSWDRARLEQSRESAFARLLGSSIQSLHYLRMSEIFNLEEKDRPASQQLAHGLGLLPPEPQVPSPGTRIPGSSPPQTRKRPHARASVHRVAPATQRSSRRQGRPRVVALVLIVVALNLGRLVLQLGSSRHDEPMPKKIWPVPSASPRASIVPDAPQTLPPAVVSHSESADGTDEIRRFDGFANGIDGVALSADGRTALSVDDGCVRLWRTDTGRELFSFHDPTAGATCIALSADGSRVLSGNTSLQLRDAATGQLLVRFSGHTDRISSVVFSADGRRALSGSFDRTMRLWDTTTGQELTRFQGDRSLVFRVALSTDGRRALSSSGDSTVRLWNTETGEELKRSRGLTPAEVESLAQPGLPNQTDVALQLWDTLTADELKIVPDYSDTVTSITFSRDGRFILTGDWRGAVRLWETYTGQQRRRFLGHRGAVLSVTVSVDGRRALSGGGDGTVRLWDTETGAELYRFEGHSGRVTSVALSADGRRALSGSADRTVRLWAISDTSAPGH